MIYWKSIIRKILKWRPQVMKLTHIWIESLWLELSKETKIIKLSPQVHFTLYFKSNCPRKLTPKFRLKMNSCWSNVKLKGQMLMKFYELDIQGKLMKQGIYWKKLNDLDLRSGINPCLKISKIRTQIWAKRGILWSLNSKYISKSNLNYINCKNYDWITLMTWLTRILGFKSHRLKCISPVSSVACVWRSRGDSDQFLQRFVINPASLWSQWSLEHRGIMKNLRFCSTIAEFLHDWIESWVNKEEEHLFKENYREKWGPSDSLKRLWTAVIARIWWLTIPRFLDYRPFDLHQRVLIDNMLFIHEFIWLLIQIKALIILIVYMLSYFKYISIILHNFMLWSKNTLIYGLLYIIEHYDFNPNYIWDHKYVFMIKW